MVCDLESKLLTTHTLCDALEQEVGGASIIVGIFQYSGRDCSSYEYCTCSYNVHVGVVYRLPTVTRS